MYTVYADLGWPGLVCSLSVCGYTERREPALSSAVLTRQPAETQHYAHCDLLGNPARQGDKACKLHLLELHSSDFVCFVCASVWQCAHWCTVSVCLCVVTVCKLMCCSI